MKKSGLQIHKKSRGRVSAVSKGRCIHGLPWSLPLASWTLILFLLLTSSFSHVQETEEKVRGNAAAGAHPHSVQEIPVQLVADEGVEIFIDGYFPQLPEGPGNGRPAGPESSMAETGDISDQVEQVQRDPSPSRSHLDALQYAEYGAELLLKSGVTEEVSGNCLPDCTAGQICPSSVDFEGSGVVDSVRPLGNLFSSNDVSSEGRSPASSRPSNLAQRHSPESGYNTETCKYHRSLLGAFLRSLCQRKEEQRCVILVDGERPCETELETRTCPLVQAEEEIPASLSATLRADDDPKSLKLSHTSHEEGENEPSNLRVNTESYREANTEKQVEHSSDPNVHDNSGNDGRQDLISSETEGYVDASYDTSTFKESGQLAFPPVADMEDLFMDELQSMIYADEEDLSSVNALTHRGVATDSQLEPVKLRRVGQVMSLDEYKKSILEKQQLGKVVDFTTLQTPRTRQSDETYNYAASSHGAKVLIANKEAKGAGYIINSDKDKYLRNPCSAESKFVVLELSEETFVDTVVIANFEFHSANLKDFEVYGSPVYPTNEWILLGQFRAENVRHRQKFTIEDPKLVRYVMLKMLSHWGSEFFCTLSSVEVFGVDVIKNLLDDWIASEESENAGRAQTIAPASHQEEFPSESQGSSFASPDGAVPEAPGVHSSTEVLISSDSVATGNREKKVDTRDEEPRAGGSGPDVHHMPGGKPPGDSVLKILMQRVKALELNQSLFDNYLEDTNVKYKAMLSELDKDLAVMSERLRNATAMSALLAMRVLEMESKQKEEKAYLEYQLALISSNFTENMEFMRWQIQSMERRELTAIIFAFCSPILATLLLLLVRCMPNRRSFPSLKHALGTEEVTETTGFQLDSCSLHSICRLSSSVVMYLSCGLIILVLSV
ncbi:hypothetical protein R1flu_005402 [Riccia fluitans]|uniref:SUN domain-containing protein n=1 Tax=Riccia fluitans TaxID=41844 RepID=A0ABD1YTR1_9MARC